MLVWDALVIDARVLVPTAPAWGGPGVSGNRPPSLILLDATISFSLNSVTFGVSSLKCSFQMCISLDSEMLINYYSYISLS